MRKAKAEVPKKLCFFEDPRNSKSPFWRKNFGTEAEGKAGGREQGAGWLQ